MKKYLIFDIGGTFVKWAIINSNFEIIENSKWPFNGKIEGKEVLIKKISNKIEEIEKQIDISAIGISTAGIVDPNTSEMAKITHNIKNWGGTNIKKELSFFTKKPIFVENDANAAIIGESTAKHLTNHKNILMITLGTDVGGGIIIDNNIYRGTHGFAGEVGFQFIDGNKRWGETASTKGLIELIKERNNVEISTYDILNSQDEKIIKSLDIWYKKIANGLTNFIVSFNFDAIIIGGGISESELFDLNKITDYINGFLLIPEFKHSYKLYKASMGNNAAIIGMTKIINNSIDIK